MMLIFPFAFVSCCIILLTTASTNLRTASGGFEECSRSPSSAEDRRSNKQKLTVGTFNAEFLFFKSLGQLKCPGSSCKWKNQGDAQKHLVAIAKTVKQMNPDILQLTEVEDCGALKKLIAEIGDDSYKPYLKRQGDTYTGQNVGLLTRVDPIEDIRYSNHRVSYPVSGSTCNWSGRSKMKGVSKHSISRFDVNGMKLTVFGVHFLARPTSKSRCVQREAQATVISDLISESKQKNDNEQIIVLGDFNDWSSSTLDKWSKQPISSVHNILEKAGNGLTNVGQQVSKAERFSNWYDENRNCVYESKEVSQLDHILMSGGLTSKIESVKYGNSLFTPGCKSKYSDHFPLAVTVST